MKKVSIIVSTKNEEKNIKLLLESIKKQTYENIETIIVDNFSTDKTQEIAKQYTPNVYVIGPERSVQRNEGVNRSTGDYLLILDADMQLDPTVVEDCILLIQNKPHVKAIIIPELSFGEGYWAQCKALERNCYLDDTGTIYAPRFFDKKIYLAVGGFNPAMISGEDWDLRNRILKSGHSIDKISSIIHHNEGKRSLYEILKKKYYYAQNADEYITNNVQGIKDIIVYVIRPALYKNIGMLIKHPRHMPGVFLMVYLEFLVGGFAAIVFKKAFWKKVFNLK